MRASDNAPVKQCAQSHAGIATTDGKLFHDFIGVHGSANDVQQRMQFGHAAGNSPTRAHIAPKLYEFLAPLGQNFYGFIDGISILANNFGGGLI